MQTLLPYILGLEFLSSFDNHNGYDGIFLGKQMRTGT
ncbi:hypothetical protein [Pedobacter agri]